MENHFTEWHAFEEALNDLDWSYTTLAARDGEAPSLQITVKSALTNSPQPSEWTLFVSASPQPVAFIPGEEEEDEDEPDQPRGYYAFEFVVPLADNVAETHEGDLIELLTFLNSKLPLTGFYWNTSDNKFFFRYMWFYHAALVESTIVLFLLEGIQALLDQYGTTLVAIAAGNLSLDDMLKKWQKEI